MVQKRALIFDFDGTVVDTFPNYIEALKEFSAVHNLSYDGAQFTVGYVDPDQFDLGWGIPLSQQREMYEIFNKFYNDENTDKQRFLPTPFAGAIDMLRTLANDYDMAIVTTRHRNSLEAILAHYCIADLFVGTRTHQCAEEGGYGLKPAPDAIHDLLKQTKHHVDDIIVIGDTTADVGMANAVGAKSIAVLWGAHPQERLQTHNPTRMIDRMADLPDTVADLFLA
ncbi:MAG TPA: HAD family hydrolase [Alphaproteobacteria bacterium]